LDIQYLVKKLIEERNIYSRTANQLSPKIMLKHLPNKNKKCCATADELSEHFNWKGFINLKHVYDTTTYNSKCKLGLRNMTICLNKHYLIRWAFKVPGETGKDTAKMGENSAPFTIGVHSTFIHLPTSSRFGQYTLCLEQERFRVSKKVA
jgi:hypothetical protein